MRDETEKMWKEKLAKHIFSDAPFLSQNIQICNNISLIIVQ
jgi:hypothetical protein